MTDNLEKIINGIDLKSDHLGKGIKIKEKKQIPAVIKQEEFEHEVKRTKMIVEEIEKNMRSKKLLADSEPLETSAINGKRRFVPSKMKSTGAGISLIGGEALGKNLEQKKASVQDTSKPST